MDATSRMATVEVAEETWRDVIAQLRAFVRRRIADPDRAEDLVGDILLRIHRNLGTVDDRERLAHWSPGSPATPSSTSTVAPAAAASSSSAPRATSPALSSSSSRMTRARCSTSSPTVCAHRCPGYRPSSVGPWR